jgi:Uma2 family endonuclease
MAEARTLLTGEDLLRISASQEPCYRFELVEGELKQMPPVGGPHASLTVALSWHLHSYVRSRALGHVAHDLGFYLRREPDTVRAPDVAFIRAARVPGGKLPQGYFPGPPDLAVEVVSPGDTAAEVEAKVRDYLASGTLRVWVVYPDTRTVVVHRPDGTATRYGEDGVLQDEELLPGFSLSLRELFS